MKYYGLLGNQLSHSFSPTIHGNILKEIQIKGQYQLYQCEKEDLKKKLQELQSMGMDGLNVTMPHKVDIMEYLDEISQEAKKLNAINTISFKDGKTIGYNTDYYGFGMMLHREAVSIKNKKGLVLGTGGASKAVVQYLLDSGIGEIIIVSRDILSAKEKYKGFQIINYDEIQGLKGYDMIINTTPCGMFPHTNQSPVKKDQLSNFHTAIDLVYNPQETLFLKYAKEKGLKAINGLYMLVGQAIKSQEIWNAIEIDQETCNKIYEDILSLSSR
ncbi:MAG: shikimate dehydrogenase [Tissierella sp.]|nr:shikimate dehydrogenase [Tissierella sp.]